MSITYYIALEMTQLIRLFIGLHATATPFQNTTSNAFISRTKSKSNSIRMHTFSSNRQSNTAAADPFIIHKTKEAVGSYTDL